MVDSAKTEHVGTRHLQRLCERFGSSKTKKADCQKDGYAMSPRTHTHACLRSLISGNIDVQSRGENWWDYLDHQLFSPISRRRDLSVRSPRGVARRIC